MKKAFILLPFLFVVPVLFAQELAGTWRIDHLLDLERKTEYRLTAPDSNEHHVYGNRLEIHSDGTFVSAYSAWCGNDCFITNTGVYEYVDEIHIRFTLKDLRTYKECGEKHLEVKHDLGVFYIQRDSTGVKLISEQ